MRFAYCCLDMVLVPFGMVPWVQMETKPMKLGSPQDFCDIQEISQINTPVRIPRRPGLQNPMRRCRCYISASGKEVVQLHPLPFRAACRGLGKHHQKDVSDENEWPTLEGHTTSRAIDSE
jgi:hypothetical protein